MQDENFAWADTKAARNWRDHAVSFSMAREAFRDAFAVEWVDARQDLSHAMAVVDSELRVHGLDGLRGIDASVMPAVTSTNTNANDHDRCQRGSRNKRRPSPD